MEVVAPGDLVQARGREWIALPSPEPELLKLRPLSGTEADIILLHLKLERQPVRSASFDLPAATDIATQDAARLLSDALHLSMRRGAGPFRSAGRLGFEPRAYQLVPLLMALRLPTVRLLIADDVGIGKTIEAGLILRELIDRGEVDRFSILCPPHLVEQWTGELKQKFDIDAVAVTATTAARLERGLPAAQTLFDAHPYTVVSLDYIKADKRRDSFARACPSMVIVDEAHSCVGTHQSKQQRFELLRTIASDATRHLVLLTATPHSGDEKAFERLLSLLDPSFAVASLDDEGFRTKLARHFVQRRRIDIVGKDWSEERAFPKHETKEEPYNLDLEHRAFHEAVLDYCLGVVEGVGADQRKQRLAFWGTLALMRCVGSSPAAAASALRNRMETEPGKLEEQVFDDDGDDTDAVDVEPASGLEQQGPLADLLRLAEHLTSAPDPKLQAVIKLLKPYIEKDKVNPVVFCRFIATADHVAAGLRKAFPKLRIDVVTGAIPAEERRERVDQMGDAEQRLLVATDCLSEGVNLQDLFDMVLHYDLSWNPTRHQQREGRVDRFGQPSLIVRSALFYSPDSAIDGAVLDVILRKAEAIRKATGVTVPLPEERGAITGALMNAVLLRKSGRSRHQLSFDFGADTTAVETRWRNAEEGEKKSRARFAQNAIKPEEVTPEWKRWKELLGDSAEVERFTSRAMVRFNAPLEAATGGFKAHLDHLPLAMKERLTSRNLDGTIRIAFADPPPIRFQSVNRSHPLPSTLAEALLEGALDHSAEDALGRCGAWTTPAVAAVTTIALLRLRFKLTIHGRREQMLLVEEANAIAFTTGTSQAITGQDARSLLEEIASSNLADVARDRMIMQGRERIATALPNEVAAFAKSRADVLAYDHGRVRATGVNVSKVSVEAVLPADVVGLFVLVPGAN
jgi:superfamily II DNA or RNA helicase